MVLSPPTLYKAHSNGTHLRKSINCLEALVYTLGKQLGKILIIEYFQGAARRYLANSSRVEMMGKVAISTLDKQRSITEALSKYLATHIKQMDSSTDVLTNILYCGVTVHT